MVVVTVLVTPYGDADGGGGGDGDVIWWWW